MEEIVSGYWELFLHQLGWNGPVTWVLLVLVALALVGVLVILRNVVFGGGGRGGGGGSSTVIVPPKYYQDRPPRPKSNLVNFRPDSEIYDFSMPSPEIDSSGLRKPLNVDMDLAREMFVSPVVQKVVSATEVNGDSEVDAPSTGVRPDWELAKKLFVPGFRRKK